MRINIKLIAEIIKFAKKPPFYFLFFSKIRKAKKMLSNAFFLKLLEQLNAGGVGFANYYFFFLSLELTV